jgi:hypothetical protein
MKYPLLRASANDFAISSRHSFWRSELQGIGSTRSPRILTISVCRAGFQSLFFHRSISRAATSAEESRWAAETPRAVVGPSTPRSDVR